MLRFKYLNRKRNSGPHVAISLSDVICQALLAPLSSNYIMVNNICCCFQNKEIRAKTGKLKPVRYFITFDI